MDNKSIKRGIFHRIKYRNVIDPNFVLNPRAKIQKTFNNSSIKRQSIAQYLNKIVRKTRCTELRTAAPQYPRIPSPSATKEDIYCFCEKFRPTTMPAFLEKDILNHIAISQSNLVMDEILNEAKEEYMEVSKTISIAMKIKTGRAILEPYRNLGRTENYAKFVKTRELIKGKFLLHFPLVRKIVDECATLPYELFNLNLMECPMDAGEFQTKLSEVFNESTQNLHYFYRKTVSMVERDNTFPTSHLDACTGLLSVNVSRIIAHTLLHVVSFTGSKKVTPYLKLNITFDGRLVLKPTADTVIQIYETFLRRIVSSPRQFHALGNKSNRTLSLCLTDEFFDHCLRRISDNINVKYIPVHDFINNLDRQFAEIYSKITSTTAQSFTDLDFEDGCNRIIYFKSYLAKIAYIPDNEYFTIGQLVLTEYRNNLNSTLRTIIENIFRELSSQHEWEAGDICEAFDIIHLRATKHPSATDEMIEIAKYMACVKNEYLMQLEERVAILLVNLTKIIMLGNLKRSHITLNSKAINWPQKILPLIEQNTQNLEQLKFEAEEKLQKVVDDVIIQIKEVYPLLDILDSMDNIEKIREYLHFITLHMKRIKEIEEIIFLINQEEVCLSFPKSTYSEFDYLKSYVYPFYHLLKICLDVQRNLSVWLDGQFDLIKYESTKLKVEDYLKELSSTYKVYRSKLRHAQDENITPRFKGTVDDPDVLNWPAPLKLCAKAIKLIQEFEPSLIVVKIMCNEALRQRHWLEMSHIAALDITPNAGTTLRKMLQIDLMSNIHKYEAISEAASKEQQLLENLEEMQQEWKDVKFTFTFDEQENYIISKFDEIESILEDHLVKICNMLTSVYVKPYKKEVKECHRKLFTIKGMINELKQVQEQLLNLKAIFSFSHIAEQMKTEHGLYQEITEIYNDYMARISADSNVDRNIDSDILNKFIHCSKLFQIINKGIDCYLEKTRQVFARFYFLSRQETLEILSGLDKMERKLQKLFSEIQHLEFNQNNEVIGVCSVDNEKLFFKSTIKISDFGDFIEKLLLEIERFVFNWVQENIGPCYEIYSQDYSEWIKSFNYQLLGLSLNISFTANGYKFIGVNLQNFLEILTNQMEQSIDLVKQSNNLLKRTIKSVIILQNYHKDVVNSFIKNGVNNLNDFHWLSKFKHHHNGELLSIKILEHTVNYGNEFLGNYSQAIILPETERCYLTLILANINYLCGICQGDAATGKSTTIKSLASSVGVRCFHFNFSNKNVSFRIVSNLLKGAALTGCWLHLTGTTNIPNFITSQMGQQLTQISDALKISSYCVLDGTKIHPKQCFVCLTKPFGNSGYPENFKSLFRVYSLIKPDFKRLFEVSLISCGFKNAGELSVKASICELFHDLNSKQIYKFNLTELKKIVKYCEEDNTIPDEEQIVCKAIRKVYSPKLTSSSDKDLFDDLFSLKTIEEKSTVSRKVNELHQLLNYHKTAIVLGETCTGKTTTIKEFLNQKDFRTDTINPKTFNLEQLQDKISDSFRKNHLIIFDGPIDSWSEILFGDKLCLNTGEILQTCSSLLFETDNLNNAPPSLINNCGILYLESNSIDWQLVVVKWVSSCVSEWCSEHKDLMIAFFKWIIPPCLDFVIDKQIYKLNNIILINNVLTLTEMLLNDACANKGDDGKNLMAWIQASLLQAGIAGFGATLSPDSRIQFDEFYKQLWKGLLDPYPELLEKVDVVIPTEGLIYDHFYIYKGKGNWKLFQDNIKNEKTEPSEYLTNYLVPTVKNVKYSSLVKMHANYNYPLVLIGPESCGKTLIIKNTLINKVDNEKYETSFITLNNNVKVNDVQNLILSKLHKTKNTFGPKSGKKSLIFIDDLNSPKADEFGVQPTNELVRQYFNYKTWNDRFHSIYFSNQGINLFGAFSLYNTFQKMCPRTLRHFNVYLIDQLSEECILRIYSNVFLTSLRKNGFPADISATVNLIVTNTFNIYESVSKQLKPTLEKWFYRFNIRDFGKVIQNCSTVKKEIADLNKKIFYRLWCHEILRVFTDRIIEDKTWLLDSVKERIANEVLENPAEEIDFDTIIFGTYLDKPSLRHFDEVELKHLADLVNVVLSKNNSKINLVVFTNFLMNLSKICRILGMSSSNALFIGPNGTGRETLVNIAGQIYGQEIFQPTKDWREALKNSLTEAGGFDRSCIFFVTDDFYKNLDDIDQLLKSGEILNFYQQEEKEDILDIVRNTAMEQNKSLDNDPNLVLLYHQKLCSENLHILISSSANLRHYIHTYPSILKYCTIICFDIWPSEALEHLSKSWIKSCDVPEQTKINSVRIFSQFHNIAFERAKQTQLIITISAFLDFVNLFVELLAMKQFQINEIKSRYLKALQKLSFAALQISEMQKSLAEYQPQLEEMSMKAAKMTEQIAKETIEVEKASDLVKHDEKIANEQAARAQVLKLDCEADLAQAIPILEDAISALNTLKPTDITLVKSMKNPPDAIKLVMAAVCVIKDVKPDKIPDPSTGRKTIDYWGPSKRILGDMNFLQTLKEFDKDHIKAELMMKIRKEYLPHKDFQPSIVAKASSAAEGLCKWIIAMDMYDKVAKEVAPKKEKLEKAEFEYAMTMQILNEKKEQVYKIEKKLADLNNLLDEATRKQRNLQRNVDLCKKKLSRAQKLISGLSEEKVRWTNTVGVLETEYNCLAGDILLSSAITAYFGAFPKEIRQKILNDYLKLMQSSNIQMSDKFDFVKIFDLNPDYWKTLGLPNDFCFVENGFIIKYCKRWPLLIDPQNQGTQWIKNLERDNSLKTIKLKTSNYIEILENCIENGKPLLIENFDQNLKYCLIDLIAKNVVMENNTKFINLGDRLIKYDDDFKLYITTTIIDIAPELYNKVSVINFILTKNSLEEQLLTIVAEVEKPNLKKVKDTLNSESEANKKSLKDIEEKILKTLSESKVDILDDEQALKVLHESKVLSKQIRERQDDSHVKYKYLEDTKSGYQQVARYSTALYFCVVDMSKLNCMYQFSFKWFRELYVQSIKTAENYRSLERRCDSIINAFTYNLYQNICRSIFEDDKLMLSLMLTFKILETVHNIHVYADLFVLLNTPDLNNPLPILNPGLNDVTWNRVCKLKLQSYFIENIDFVLKICNDPEPENKEFPSSISGWRKFIILTLLIPKRIKFAAIKLIVEYLGGKFINPPSFDLNTVFIESYILSPLIFLLSPGLDPSQTLKSFAFKKKFDNKLKFLSVGPLEDIDESFTAAQKQGLWICLQNVHLSPNLLSYLELKLDSMDYDNTHENFRLWLTTEQTELPFAILENSFKITYDTPRGLQRKLFKLYTNDPVSFEKFYSGCPGKQEMFTRLLYGMAVFHSVILERKHFDNLAWNYPYELNELTFNYSLKQLQSIINQHVEPCQELLYLIGVCNYGGHVNNQWDRCLLQYLLNDCLCGNITRPFQAYNFPTRSDYQDYINHILKLPKQDNIELFGYSLNFQQIINLKEKDEILQSLNLVYNIEDKQEQSVDLELFLSDLPEKITLQQFSNKILQAELQLYNNLLDSIKFSLSNLINALKGEIPSTPLLEEILRSLTDNQVPKFWLKNSYPSKKNLFDYKADLKKRVEFLNVWGKGETETLWLACFFNPKALFAETKIKVSKKKFVLVDEVGFCLNNTKSDDALCIQGLFIAGARWDDHCLVEANESDQYFLPLPIIYIEPLLERNCENFYRCPIYRISNDFNDNNYIETILLKTNKPKEHWLRRNVAIFCQTDF